MAQQGFRTDRYVISYLLCRNCKRYRNRIASDYIYVITYLFRTKDEDPVSNRSLHHALCRESKAIFVNSSNPQAAASIGAGRADLYAAALSGLCLMHCLALPLLASLLPLAGLLSENELIHHILVIAAAPATLWVAWVSLPIRGTWPFLAGAPAGLGLLLLAAFVPSLEGYEKGLTTFGATMLATAHLWRWAIFRSNVAQSAPAPEAGRVSGQIAKEVRCRTR